jgi:hypothetical protein
MHMPTICDKQGIRGKRVECGVEVRNAIGVEDESTRELFPLSQNHSFSHLTLVR